MLRFLRKKHTLPNLPYDYNALEPVISAEIMQLHHQKHHNAYVTNLNLAEEKLAKAVAEKDATSEIECQSMIKFNGGGELLQFLIKEFGSFENFKTMFSTKTAAIQGSGWGWLGFNKQFNRVEIATTENQDPLVLKGLVPLLGIDVWEHAYYLQYKNVRPDYLKNIWKIINWKDVSERLQRAK